MQYIKYYLYGLVTMSLVMIICVSMTACSSSDDDSLANKDILYSDAPADLDLYDLGILDKTDMLLMMGSFNSECVRSLDCLLGDDLLSVSFDERGLPESFMSNKNSLIISFGNYSEDYFGAAISVSDATFLIDSIDSSGLFPGSKVMGRRHGEDDDKVKYEDVYSDRLRYAGHVLENVFKRIYDASKDRDISSLTGLLQDKISILNPVFKVLKASRITQTTETGVFGSETASLFQAIGISDNIGRYMRARVLEMQNKYGSIFKDLNGMLVSGKSGLKVTLSWNFDADIDLHAFEPDGTHIYNDNPTSKSGGYLDVDNKNGGYGAKENIYWENPVEGLYQFYLDYYAGFESGICTATVTYKGKSTPYQVSMTDGSWVNFANVEISGQTRSDNPQSLILEVHIKPCNIK